MARPVGRVREIKIADSVRLTKLFQDSVEHRLHYGYGFIPDRVILGVFGDEVLRELFNRGLAKLRQRPRRVGRAAQTFEQQRVYQVRLHAYVSGHALQGPRHLRQSLDQGGPGIVGRIIFHFSPRSIGPARSAARSSSVIAPPPFALTLANRQQPPGVFALAAVALAAQHIRTVAAGRAIVGRALRDIVHRVTPRTAQANDLGHHFPALFALRLCSAAGGVLTTSPAFISARVIGVSSGT